MSKINIEVSNVSNDPTVHVQMEGGFTLYSMYACCTSLLSAFSKSTGFPEEVLEGIFSILKEGSTSITLDLGHMNNESEEESDV